MRKKGLEETLKLTRGRVGGCLGRVLEKCGNGVCGERCVLCAVCLCRQEILQFSRVAGPRRLLMLTDV